MLSNLILTCFGLILIKKVFGPVLFLITGRDAFYTHRKIDSIDEITVGGADIYEPRCWEYHGFMNNRKES